jgi:hypothetical protein
MLTTDTVKLRCTLQLLITNVPNVETPQQVTPQTVSEINVKASEIMNFSDW